MRVQFQFNYRQTGTLPIIATSNYKAGWLDPTNRLDRCRCSQSVNRVSNGNAYR